MKTSKSRVVEAVVITASALLFLSAVSLPAADDLKGAAAVLQIVSEQSGKKSDAPKTSEAARLRADLETFTKTRGTLPADDAAKQWLVLMDRFLTLPPQARSRHEQGEAVTADQVIAALPPPAAWDALARAVNSRPAAKAQGELQETGLRLLVAALNNDQPARDREIQALQARAAGAARSEVYVLRSLFEQLNETLLTAMDDPDAILKLLEHRLSQSSSERSSSGLNLPNIAVLVGEEKAAAFLRKALTTEKVTLEVEDQNATSRLAQKIALELIEQLKTPQWHLVNSLDAVELFEAMDKKFSKPKPAARPAAGTDLLELPTDEANDYVRTQAETYYFLGLISKGRAKDAVAVAQKLAKAGRPSLPGEALEAMERAGYTKALDDFFFELLTQDASLPYWNEYVQLAAKAGRTERMLKLARGAAADDNMAKKKRASIRQNLFRALLADGQVEEGVAEIKRLLALEPNIAASEEIPHGQLGLMLARLGVLTKKPEWTEEGIKAARDSLTNTSVGPGDWSRHTVPPALADLLFEQNRVAEAEAILTDALGSAARQPEGRMEMSYGGGDHARPILSALATLYHRANRPADVLALLDNAPYWGVKDIAEFTENYSGMYGSYSSRRMQVRDGMESLPVAHLAAIALLALNRQAEARVLNEAVLAQYPGYDRAYELSLKLNGDGAVTRLDELFARDQFEERPLIWKARVLADKKDYVAAEEVVRRAIAIDPSDGEQGPGDRMRAYAVLADIREARGDQKDALFFRGVVKAIRLSEEADSYYAAGLLKRAVAMYQESLKSFSDAYCIQSRLAIQLADLGLHDQAEEHYRRAYELMPDSFGRVESHCFGCERAFGSSRAQSLAEKVFTELAAKQPNKPQVHYLLGYLRSEQQRYAEALPHFRTATRLDPEYLNAWSKLLEASAHVHMPAQERDSIAFNLLRLDPARRHAGADLRHVTDLRGLWNAVEAGGKLQPQRPTSLYTLGASKAAIEKRQATGNHPTERLYSVRTARAESQTPGFAIAQTTFVQSAVQLLNYVNHEDQ